VTLHVTRRAALGAGLAAGLPRFAVAQADARPVVTVAVQKLANSNTLEPLREQSNVGTRIASSFCESLLDMDWIGDLSLRGGLAESWRRVDDRTVEFTLRPNLRFHDGRALTAEDVVFSFGPARMWGDGPEARNLFGSTPGRTGGKAPPPEVSAVARRAYPAFEKIEVVDARTVRWVNRTPDVTLEGRLARTIGVVMSQTAFEAAPSWLEWARKPVGTGPYRVVEFRPDQLLVLEAFDEHWAGRPPIRRLRFVEVPEVSSRINMLLSGEADFACDIPPDQVSTVERSARHEVVGGNIMNHRLTVFDKNQPALRNPLLRRAMTHAIDRQSIVDALWGGRARIPKGLQFEFYGEMFHADWEVPKFDLAEARRLVRESGYRGEPIPYRLLNNYYTAQVPTAQILVEGWRAAGINVAIEMRENFPQVLSNQGARGIWDWSNSANFNDPVSSLPNNHGPQGQQWQVGAWRNEEFGQLSALLDSSVDRAERRRAVRRMLEIAEREDPAYAVLHQSVNLTAKRKDIAWKPAQSFFMDFTARNWGRR
jgi:peptide/nickel transport system substrate-binding protein